RTASLCASESTSWPPLQIPKASAARPVALATKRPMICGSIQNQNAATAAAMAAAAVHSSQPNGPRLVAPAAGSVDREDSRVGASWAEVSEIGATSTTSPRYRVVAPSSAVTVNSTSGSGQNVLEPKYTIKASRPATMSKHTATAPPISHVIGSPCAMSETAGAVPCRRREVKRPAREGFGGLAVGGRGAAVIVDAPGGSEAA